MYTKIQVAIQTYMTLKNLFHIKNITSSVKTMNQIEKTCLYHDYNM